MFFVLLFVTSCSDDNTSAPYVIGEVGPAGGLIFYDKGNDSDGWRFLEAAPLFTEFSSAYWSNPHDSLIGTEIGIGAGKTNTIKIASAIASESGRVAQLCLSLSVTNNEISYQDWFLPSSEETRFNAQQPSCKKVWEGLPELQIIGVQPRTQQ